MGEPDEEFPKSVDFLPDETLNLSYLRRLQQNSSIEEIWIPRFGSLKEVNADQEEIWDLSIGVVPITGIDYFIIEWDGKIIVFEFEDEGWHVEEPTEREEILGQVFVHQMKPYVDIRRAVQVRKLDQMSE